MNLFFPLEILMMNLTYMEKIVQKKYSKDNRIKLDFAKKIHLCAEKICGN